MDPVLLPHPSFGFVCFLSFFLYTIHINAQLRTQDAQAQTVEKGERDSNDSQKSALGPRKANAMTASSVSSS